LLTLIIVEANCQKMQTLRINRKFSSFRCCKGLIVSFCDPIHFMKSKSSYRRQRTTKYSKLQFAAIWWMFHTSKCTICKMCGSMANINALEYNSETAQVKNHLLRTCHAFL